MQQSDFDIPTNGTATSLVPPDSKEALQARLAGALEAGDYQTAGRLLQEAGERFPDDPSFSKLAIKQRRLADRFERVYSLLKETRDALDEDSFVRAVGAFREAANLSHSYADLENAAFAVAVDGAEDLGPRNWRIAKALLEDAQRLNNGLVIPARLLDQIAAAEREESISNVLAETAMAKPADLEQARGRLQQALERYPEDNVLLGRLKSIESTIEERDRHETRQRQLAKISELRASLQNTEDVSEVEGLVARAAALAEGHGADPDFVSVIVDMRDQAVRAHKATTALAEDRIEECLEECAWVLSRMRHHQLFLKLKNRAEERELSMVDDYSNAVTRVKQLLAEGKFEEASQICARANSRLPQFTDLRDLAREIEQRKGDRDRLAGEHVSKAAHLIERGEGSLRERQFRLAEQAFVNALEAYPGDEKVSGQVANALYGFAQSVAETDLNSAHAAVECAGRLLLSKSMPESLTEMLRKKREQAKEERSRWASLQRIDELKGRAVEAKNRRAVAALQNEADNGAITSSHPDVILAASELNILLKERAAELSARRPAWLPYATAAAALLLLGWGTYRIFAPSNTESAESKKPPMEIEPAPAKSNAPESAAVRPPADAKAVVRDTVPVTAPERPAPAMAEPSGAKISTPPKTNPADAAWSALRANANVESLKAFTAKFPESPHAVEAMAQVEHLRWHDVDRNDPEALRAFLDQHPSGTFAPQARQDLDHALEARERSLEADDWSRVDSTNRASVEDFLHKHPTGLHASHANDALRDLDRKSRAAELLAADEAAWRRAAKSDAPALQAYLNDYPAGRHHDEAAAALASIPHPPAESAAVLSVIKRLANAWNAKDIDTILAIQKNLNRRSVKAELAQARQIVMRINPASAPKIDGKQAVVVCRRQASEVFVDGTRKENPESLISYVMEKSGDAWTITEAR